MIIQPERIVGFHPVSKQVRNYLSRNNNNGNNANEYLEEVHGVPHILKITNADDFFSKYYIYKHKIPQNAF
jgi:hypothetical protein